MRPRTIIKGTLCKINITLEDCTPRDTYQTHPRVWSTKIMIHSIAKRFITCGNNVTTLPTNNGSVTCKDV